MKIDEEFFKYKVVLENIRMIGKALWAQKFRILNCVQLTGQNTASELGTEFRSLSSGQDSAFCILYSEY